MPVLDSKTNKAPGATAEFIYMEEGQTYNATPELIASSLTAPYTVSTIAALRDVAVVAGKAVQPLGYYAAGDGGGGPVRVGKAGAAPGTYVDNGGSIIVPTGGDGSAAWVWEWSGAINIKWAGAKGDGVSNDSVSLNAALSMLQTGGVVKFPPGEFTSGPVTLPDNVSIVGDGTNATTLTATGATSVDFLTVGSYSQISNIKIDCADSLGIKVPVNKPNQKFSGARVISTASNCLVFEADGGSGFSSINSEYYTGGTVGTVAAVKVDGTDTAARTRKFVNTDSGGCTLFDFGGANDFFASNFFSNGLIYGASSNKVFLQNVRIGSSAGTVTLAGAGHILSGISSVAIINNADTSILDVQTPSWNITDNGTGNSVKILYREYTPTWTGAASNPALGNGTIKGSWTREGQRVHVEIDLVIGSTTTFGGGAWKFSLPVSDYAFGPNTYSGGGAILVSGSPSNALIVGKVVKGSAIVEPLYVDTSGVLRNVDATHPAAWTTGSFLRFAFDYYTP